MIERAFTVVIVAANTGMKTLRLPWYMRWSVMMIVLVMEGKAMRRTFVSRAASNKKLTKFRCVP